MTDPARALRNSLGCFATGVSIVTAMGGDGVPAGVTINSFSSVSLDPPLILWSLDKKSDTFAVFAKAKSFCVNVLRSDHQALSQRFSRKGHRRLTGPDWILAKGEAPVFKHALAHFACRVAKRLDGGDHVILLGRVLDHAHTEGHAPLLFYRGRYRGLAHG